jgi:hypothetical protein
MEDVSLEELKRQRKDKGKDMVELEKNNDVNKQVSDKEAIKYLKINETQ